MRRNLTEIQKVSKYQVGNYTVFLDNFEAVALPSLDSDTVRIMLFFILLSQSEHFHVKTRLPSQ